MQILFFCAIIILVIFSLAIVIDAAEQRNGCSKGSAVFLSIFFTPIAGLLYCLNFPPKKVEEKSQS